MTRTDVELTLPDSHAKCVSARPLYDAKHGTTNSVNSTPACHPPPPTPLQFYYV